MPESRTRSYVTERYGDEIVDDVLDVWERVETGKLTYCEASARLEIDHVDCLRVASELELLR